MKGLGVCFNKYLMQMLAWESCHSYLQSLEMDISEESLTWGIRGALTQGV